MGMMILRLNIAGMPVEWIDWQQATLLYAKDLVAWTLGDDTVRIHGGINRLLNARSFLDIHPIIATRGRIGSSPFTAAPPLINRELFRRDRHTCMYCLQSYHDRKLTRDHVVPLSRGGLDIWTNVVTACRPCNQAKSNRLLQNTGMRLKAVPYTPNHAEWLILRNRHILADQMAFLEKQCPKNRH